MIAFMFFFFVYKFFTQCFLLATFPFDNDVFFATGLPVDFLLGTTLFFGFVTAFPFW